MKQFLREWRFFYLKSIKWRNYSIGRNIYVGRRVYICCKEKMIIGNIFYIDKDFHIEYDTVIGNQVGIVGTYDCHLKKRECLFG